ncbi:MAG: 50S ribosomal protein L24 [Patescibacteria group bacterium]
MKIKKDDKVAIIAGKDKGKTGKVMHAFPKDKQVIVEGLNLMKKHVKPRKQGESGQIIEFPAPMDVSNVKLICPKCGETTRVGIEREGKNKKRVCKKCKKQFE